MPIARSLFRGGGAGYHESHRNGLKNKNNDL
jgi:hypothetical protein